MKRTHLGPRRLGCEVLECRDLLATFLVENASDSGVGSLRAAVAEANSNPGPDLVVFDLDVTGQSIFLNSEIVNEDELTIDARGAGPINLDLTSADSTPGVPDGQGIRAFSSMDSLTLRNLNITGGDVDGKGGAVFSSASLHLEMVQIQNNSSTNDGGGIRVENGEFAMHSSSVSGNTASAGDGGGVSVYTQQAGDVQVADSIISGNAAIMSADDVAGLGGGMHIKFTDTDSDSQLTISDTEIDANHASSSGGGLYLSVNLTSTQITASTISNNTSDAGGGIHFRSRAGLEPLTIRETTISGNTATEDGGCLLYTSPSPRD